MNIKISIKDCECFSEVDQKKRTMLYAPPQKDNKKRNQTKNTQKNGGRKNSDHEKIDRNTEKYRQSERQLLNGLKKGGSKQSNLDAIKNSNNIIQKQNQILEGNQKTLNDMIKNQDKNKNGGAENERKTLNEALDKIQEQVKEIRKVRDEMVNLAKEFNKTMSEFEKGRGNINSGIPSKMNNLNENCKDLIEVSKNHLEGLQNLQGLKSLQNFNVEGYTQAINSLKRQIAQYQKQSENIERQLRIRAAKLEKLEVPPNFQKELLQPYENHLNEKVNAIDLHSIREKVYEKIGHYDYGKFEFDTGQLMLEAKGQIGNFNLICQEYRINVPEIKFDARQLKSMELKLPSVLDEYKNSKGIVFEQKKENARNMQNKKDKNEGLKKTHSIQETISKGNSKKADNLKRIISKPTDKSNNIRLTRMNEPPKTILTNNEEKEQRSAEKRMKKIQKQRKNEGQFEKYLQNRAREELELIYKERKEKLERMQRQLNDYCEQPTYINLNLTKQQVKKGKPRVKEEEEYEDEFQREEEQEKKEPEKEERKEVNPIKEMGKDILKEKLKIILKNKKTQPHEEAPRRSEYTEGIHTQNVAEGVINLINNTLTQVNANLANTIQRRMKSNQHRKPSSLERKSPKKIQIPKLQQFRSPPVFTMGVRMNEGYGGYGMQSRKPIEKKQKIEPKNYDHLDINLEDEHQDRDESQNDLRISDVNY